MCLLVAGVTKLRPSSLAAACFLTAVAACWGRTRPGDFYHHSSNIQLVFEVYLTFGQLTSSGDPLPPVAPSCIDVQEFCSAVESGLALAALAVQPLC